MITKHQINILRMADLLWDHYTHAGLVYFLVKYYEHDKYYDQASAYRRTALNTYLAFCKRHNIQSGYVKGLE